MFSLLPLKQIQSLEFVNILTLASGWHETLEPATHYQKFNKHCRDSQVS